MRLHTLEEETSDELQKLAYNAAKQRQESKEKSFLGRFFKSSDEKVTHIESEDLRRLITTCGALVEQLQEKINNTPSSKDEQTLLVKELKSRKKDLQLTKTEIAIKMKDIRTVARQESGNAGSSIISLLSDKKNAASNRAAERRNIQQSKERDLAPLEDKKAQIDRSILAIEREILRIESFR